MSKIVVLGGGLVGSVIAADLARDAELSVTVADRSAEALQRASERAARGGGRVETVVCELDDERRLGQLLEDHDVAVGALASQIGYATLRRVIEAGKPYCDISFMPEDAWELDALARERGVTAVVDFGVAPGMSNVLAARGARALDECRSLTIYVGGLPVAARWPHHYKAAFAPADVIEEYTRPVKVVEHGEVVVREALSGPEFVEIEGVGTLEALNTDGLRSLTASLDVPNMTEKTLRYPEHASLMRALKAIGLFGSEPVRVGDVDVRPVDLLSRLMLPQWAYAEGEQDLTVMRVVAEGLVGGRPARRVWELFDRYDPQTGTSSMARTTAFPCALMARELASGRFDPKGVVAPEAVVDDEALVERLLAGLRERGVDYRATTH